MAGCCLGASTQEPPVQTQRGQLVNSAVQGVSLIGLFAAALSLQLTWGGSCAGRVAMQTGEGQNAITKGRPRKELQARLRGIARALYSGSHAQQSKSLLTPPPPPPTPWT